MQKEIVQVCRRYEPHIGGVERHVYGLNQELLKRGYKITVITEQYDQSLKLREKLGGVRVWRIPYPATLTKSQVWSWLAGREQIFKRADVVQIHDVFWWYYPLRIKWRRQPVLTTFHGYETDPPRWQAVWQRRLIKRLSMRVMGVGIYLTNWYGTRFDEVTYGAAAMKAYPLPHTQAVVSVGRLAQDTGVMEYLEVIKRLNSQWFLDIYGDGPLREMVSQKIRTHHLAAAVHPATANPERVLRQARLVFSSQYLSILEAWQMKRPVAAIYLSPMKRDYLLCHPAAKHLITGGSAQALAERIKAMTRNKEAEMIDGAYHWAKQQTWSRLADQYEQLWRSDG